MIGLVSLRCSVKQIATEAINNASYMCSRIHGDSPEVLFQLISFLSISRCNLRLLLFDFF
jgi:hypothetical protein